MPAPALASPSLLAAPITPSSVSAAVPPVVTVTVAAPKLTAPVPRSRAFVPPNEKLPLHVWALLPASVMALPLVLSSLPPAIVSVPLPMAEALLISSVPPLSLVAPRVCGVQHGRPAADLRKRAAAADGACEIGPFDREIRAIDGERRAAVDRDGARAAEGAGRAAVAHRQRAFDNCRRASIRFGVGKKDRGVVRAKPADRFPEPPITPLMVMLAVPPTLPIVNVVPELRVTAPEYVMVAPCVPRMPPLRTILFVTRLGVEAPVSAARRPPLLRTIVPTPNALAALDGIGCS